jgi:hypothetical protein
MESHKPRASQSQRDRRRSRSPFGSRLGTAVEPALSTGRRARSLRRFQEALDEMEANKEKWAAVEEKWAAEEERRHNLPPAERLREDGQELLRELEDNDRIVFLLQEPPPETLPPGAMPRRRLLLRPGEKPEWPRHHAGLSYLCRQGHVL